MWGGTSAYLGHLKESGKNGDPFFSKKILLHDFIQKKNLGRGIHQKKLSRKKFHNEKWPQ